MPAVPVDLNPPGPDAYEEVTNGAQTGGLGKSEPTVQLWRAPGIWQFWLELGIQAVLHIPGPGGMRGCLGRGSPFTPQLLSLLSGFNLRIGRPKGPRDPPAEWTRV